MINWISCYHPETTQRVHNIITIICVCVSGRGVCLCVCVCVRVHACMCISLSACMSVCISLSDCVYVCITISLSDCMYVCISLSDCVYTCVYQSECMCVWVWVFEALTLSQSSRLFPSLSIDHSEQGTNSFFLVESKSGHLDLIFPLFNQISDANFICHTECKQTKQNIHPMQKFHSKFQGYLTNISSKCLIYYIVICIDLIYPVH